MFHSTIVLYVAMNKFVQTLDKRLELLASKEGPATVAKKVRHDGAPSVSVPPINAPGWSHKELSYFHCWRWVGMCMHVHASQHTYVYVHTYIHAHTHSKLSVCTTLISVFWYSFLTQSLLLMLLMFWTLCMCENSFNWTCSCAVFHIIGTVYLIIIGTYALLLTLLCKHTN